MLLLVGEGFHRDDTMRVLGWPNWTIKVILSPHEAGNGNFQSTRLTRVSINIRLTVAIKTPAVWAGK